MTSAADSDSVRGSSIRNVLVPRLQLKLHRLTLCAAVLGFAAHTAFAGCAGSLASQNCVDESGNNYTVQRFGNTAPINSIDAQPGSTSNHIAKTAGSSTFVSGVAADGSTWNETITDYGNGSRTISGVDGNGIVYNRYCTTYACN